MEPVRRSFPRCAPIGVAALLAGVAVGWLLPRGEGPVFATDQPEPTRGMMPATFANVVERAAPGVVTVRAQLRSQPEDPPVTAASEGSNRPVFAPQRGFRSGSGFIVNARGLVVTSRHVVLDSESIDVILQDHGRLRAELVGEDVATDLALLRLADAPKGLTALAIGNSEGLRPGDWIVAVGNPLDFTQTVTAGVVSFVGRHLPHSDFGVTNDFLQFSAPVNPGSSGCPVLDLSGCVVGVTTQAALDAQGISFAVPSRTLKWALDEMQRRPDGRVRRGYLGIEFATHAAADDDASAPGEGAVIVKVATGEPADRAGLKRGDVVLRVDSEPVTDARALHERIVRGDPGTSLKLHLLRNGIILDPIEAVLGEVGAPRSGTRSN
jgi:serine protease Do